MPTNKQLIMVAEALGFEVFVIEPNFIEVAKKATDDWLVFNPSDHTWAMHKRMMESGSIDHHLYEDLDGDLNNIKVIGYGCHYIDNNSPNVYLGKGKTPEAAVLNAFIQFLEER